MIFCIQFALLLTLLFPSNVNMASLHANSLHRKPSLPPSPTPIPSINRSDGREPGDDLNGAVAVVDNLILKRDAATFKFIKGEIYFLTPVEGRVVGAVFVGDMEMSLVPPTAVEKKSLARFSWDADAPQQLHAHGDALYGSDV